MGAGGCGGRFRLREEDGECRLTRVPSGMADVGVAVRSEPDALRGRLGVSGDVGEASSVDDDAEMFRLLSFLALLRYASSCNLDPPPKPYVRVAVRRCPKVASESTDAEVGGGVRGDAGSSIFGVVVDSDIKLRDCGSGGVGAPSSHLARLTVENNGFVAGACSHASCRLRCCIAKLCSSASSSFSSPMVIVGP